MTDWPVMTDDEFREAVALLVTRFLFDRIVEHLHMEVEA